MRPSREELFARLREVEGARSDEELAVRLGKGVRTLARWKHPKGPREGPSYEETIDYLSRAGWLAPDGERPSAEDAELLEVLQALRQNFDELVVRLQQRLARPEDDEGSG